MEDQDRGARLRRIVERAKSLPFYRERLAGVDPAGISPDHLAALPFIDRDDLVAQFRSSADGGFLRDDIVQIHLTPSPGVGRMPEFMTAADLRWQAEATAAMFARCGLGPEDRCLVVFSYHLLAGGWLMHEGLTRLGCAVLPMGPGEAEQVAEIGSTYGFNVLISNPSFARRIGEAGGRFEILVAAGEPFSAVPGYREQVQEALGCRAYDAYGLSETGLVAAETEAQDGLRPVEEACILEVVDPQSLEPVGTGEKGELVITSLTREGMPILRFRTGDLSLRGSSDGKLHLPRGVFGRTDTMIKVKGVKFYPKELLFLLAGTPGVNFRNYQVLLRSNPDGTDHATLRIQGEAGVDVQTLAQRIRAATGIRMNDISVEPEVTGPLLEDQRFAG